MYIDSPGNLVIMQIMGPEVWGGVLGVCISEKPPDGAYAA